MTLTKRWAGKTWGTNIGHVFVKLDGEDDALSGTLHMNEPGVGVAVYDVQGSFDAPNLALTGQPPAQNEDAEYGDLTVTGTMNSKGEIHGDWQTTIGTAGTFVLYPHSGGEQPADVQRAEQFHSARHDFGAIEIDREQIIEIAEKIRQEFPMVIITVTAGTEQARYLEDFKELQFNVNKAQVIKIRASKADGSDASQAVAIEFGPQVNFAMTQGANEAWVLGQLETLKRDLKRYEQTYITNFKRWGVGVNQLLFVGAVVFLPSLNGLRDRTILMATIVALMFSVNWMHRRYLPFAAIYLQEKKKGLFGRLWPSLASWGIGVGATIVGTVVAAYLVGWLEIPVAPSDPKPSISAPEN